MAASPWVVRADGVWKRYSRTLKSGTVHALRDSLRGVFRGARAAPAELRKGEFWSLRDVSFALRAGESLAVCGRNGAGKSTLLRLLSGVSSPDRGELRVRGRIVSLLGVGVGFNPLLSGRENAFILGSLLGLSQRELEGRLPEISDFAQLQDFLDMPVKHYSRGMQARLGFGVAMHVDPQVLLIDEVLAVGDESFREHCMDRLLDLKRKGASLVVVSHSTSRLRRLGDRALWLDRGRSLGHGPASEVLGRYQRDLRERPLELGASVDPAEAPSVEDGAPPELISLEVGGRALEQGEEVVWGAGEARRLVAGWRFSRRQAAVPFSLTVERAGQRVAELTSETQPETYPTCDPAQTCHVAFDLIGLEPGAYALQLTAGSASPAARACRVEGDADAASPEAGGLAAALGYADLSAQLTFRHEPRAAGEREVGPLGIERFSIGGSRASLQELVGGSVRAESGAPRRILLAQGERAQLLLRVQVPQVLSDPRVELWLADASGEVLAGCRALDRVAWAAGAVEIDLGFVVAVVPGDYTLGFTVRGAGADGERFEHRRELGSSHVLGPRSSGPADAWVELLGVEEERDDASGSSARIEGLELEPAVWRGRDPVALTLRACFGEAVDEPSFKLAWVTTSGRTVARVQAPALEPVAAGEARVYRLRCRPHLAPGVYTLNAALQEGPEQSVVVSGQELASCTVAARVPDGWVEIDPISS